MSWASVFQQTAFHISAPTLALCPEAVHAEIAFVGRSNVGKSSVINTLCQQKTLAKASKTPGRTQLINYFSVRDERYLVDLPGYGYARVGAATQRLLENMLSSYLAGRQPLKGLILIVDARRGLGELETAILEAVQLRALPLHVLLNKADKLNKSEQTLALRACAELLKDWPQASWQLFSCLKRQGLDEAYQRMAHLLAL